LRPLAAQAAERAATVVVLATPPFWFATAMTLAIDVVVQVTRANGKPAPVGFARATACKNPGRWTPPTRTPFA
jgi:hypothetical protein